MVNTALATTIFTLAAQAGPMLPVGVTPPVQMNVAQPEEGGGDDAAVDAALDPEPSGEASAEQPAPAPAAQPAPAAPPPQKGIGLIIGGSLTAGLVGLPLTAWGAAVTAAGVAVKKIDDGGVGATNAAGGLGIGVGVTIMVIGILALGGGAAMIGVGGSRLSKYNKWAKSKGARLPMPTVGATAYRTPVYGFQLRF